MPDSQFVTHTLADMAVKDRYFLLTACIVPRPIAFVTSFDATGTILNAAPFSYFNGVCSDPPLIVLGLAAKPGDGGLVRKDTTRNILATGEFVVNTCSLEMASIVQRAGEDFPADQSEVDVLGLGTVPSLVVKPPRLAVAPVALECRLYQSLELGPKKSTLILGEVLHLHVKAEFWVRNRVDFDAIQPLARLGGGRYSGLTPSFKPGG